MFSPNLQHPKRILLAVDGSQNSFYAAELVRDLPLLPTTEIIALACYQDESNVHIYEGLLNQAAQFFHMKGIQIQTRLIFGHPAQGIMEYAAANMPDLIVMGAVGLRATLGILLGGIAQQVVEYACCPVLVVRGPYQGWKKLALLVDGSPASQAAVNYMAGFSLNEETEINVMHILPPVPTPEYVARAWAVPVEAIEPVSLQEIRESLAVQAKEEESCIENTLIKPAVEQLQKAGLRVDCGIRRGDAASEIIEYAKNTPVDCIVAGSRGLSQVRGWLLGSVSRKLVHYAPCSVLIVKTPQN